MPWPPLSLVAQFTIVSSCVVVLGMLVLSTYLSTKIEESLKHDAGAAAALFVDSFIVPHVVGSPTDSPLNPERVEAIEKVMNRRAITNRVVSMKIWGPGGLVLYSNHRDLVGKRFEISKHLATAYNGEVATEFDKLDDAESAWERLSGMPLMEVYAPVLDESGNVVAVAEFYERAEHLRDKLQEARWEGWAVTASISVGMILGLFGIVARGSRTIDRQRQDAVQRVKQLYRLLKQNEELRGRVEQASRRATEESERFLRRIGADLHDGPTQLISLALLRLDDLEASPAAGEVTFKEDMALIRSTLRDAMWDVRNICAGLSMPEIENLNIRDALLATIRHHERRTKTTVDNELHLMPLELPSYLKICACRFVQEGLTNAFRHAKGKDQRVRAHVIGGCLLVEVEDGGPGLNPCNIDGGPPRLGLTGMWDRIESLGGRMQVISHHPKRGTLLRARLPFAGG